MLRWDQVVCFLFSCSTFLVTNSSFLQSAHCRRSYGSPHTDNSYTDLIFIVVRRLIKFHVSRHYREQIGYGTRVIRIHVRVEVFQRGDFFPFESKYAWIFVTRRHRVAAPALFQPNTLCSIRVLNFVVVFLTLPLGVFHDE